VFSSAGHEVHKEPRRTRRILAGGVSELCASDVIVVTLHL